MLTRIRNKHIFTLNTGDLLSPDENTRLEFPGVPILITTAERDSQYPVPIKPCTTGEHALTLTPPTLIYPETIGFQTPPRIIAERIITHPLEECPWECGYMYQKGNLVAHGEVCVTRVRLCDYTIYGCRFLGNESQRLIHQLEGCNSKHYEDAYIEWFKTLKYLFPDNWTSLLHENQSYVLFNPFTRKRAFCKLKLQNDTIRVQCLHAQTPVPTLNQCIPVPFPIHANALNIHV